MHSFCMKFRSVYNAPVTRRFCLAFFWVFGLVTGLYFASKASAVSVSVMRTIMSERVSIFGLALMFSFPLVLSAIAVRLSVPLLLLPVAFFKALSFSYCSYSLIFAFGNAGWLVRWLFIFSDSCIVVVLLWFWMRNITGNRAMLKRDLLACSAFAILFGCIDYFIVSPFAVMLFNH